MTTTTTVNHPPPSFGATCLTDIAVNTGAGSTTCSSTASWTPPTATDTCGSTTLTADHNPGDAFPVGQTTVTYTATDAAGAQTICSFKVTVTDTTAPTINCGAVPAQNADADATCLAAVPDVRDLVRAQSSDNCTAQAALVVTQIPAAGSIVSGSGSHPITVTLADAVGNTDTCSVPFTVNE